MCPDDGNACNGTERCDPETNRCVRADPPVCDDGLICNGIETCDPERGCVAGEPVTCEAKGAYCDENTGACACDESFLPPDCTIKTALFPHFGQVRALAEDRGVLWITTDNGLWALDFAGTPSDRSDDEWARFDELDGATGTGTISIDEGGAKWLAGDGARALARLDDGGTPLNQEDDSWQHYRFGTERVSPIALGVDASGTLWLGRSGETLTFSNAKTPEDRSDDRWRLASELNAPKPLIELPRVDAIASEPSGLVWLGSSAGGLFAYRASTGQFAELTHGMWGQVQRLTWEAGALWLAVGSGEAGAPEQLARVPVPDPEAAFDISDADWVFTPAPHAVEAFDVDPGGRVWVSPPGPGLSCLESANGAWSQWMINEPVRAILARSSTDLWLGAGSVFHLEHGGSCASGATDPVELVFENNLRAPARDVEIEGAGIWFATDAGVDFLDTGGTPFDTRDDRWVHFDERDVAGLVDLQGALVGPGKLKYFWGQNRVFILDDRGTPLDKTDDTWVGHDTELPLWVSGVVDSDGILMVIARTGFRAGGTPRIIEFDPGGTPGDSSDDAVVTIDSGLPGMGRTMAIDTAGQVWVGTEADQYSGNLFHWDRSTTPLDGTDDVWTPMRAQEGRVWKLVADPTGGVWGTVGGPDGGVFQFYDNGTPTDLTDDYWHLYPELGSAMEIGPNGDGWFRMPGGAGILHVGGTPRDPSDDSARVLLSPDALRFESDLYTNGTIDDEGRFWVVDENAQVFEVVGER